MSKLKTQISDSEVLAFLHIKFPQIIQNFKIIHGGEMSQGFSFLMENKDYIIRINQNEYSFRKDKYAYENFANANIPIPKILEIGKFNNDYSFAISELALGKPLDLFSKKEIIPILPQLVKILDDVNNSKIMTEKYGDLDINGNGQFESWLQFLQDIKGNFSTKWEQKYRKILSDMNIESKFWKKYEGLYKYLPEERYLIHGDYGYNNIISNKEKITGVLDWENSKVGDFLYDVAWLEFWDKLVDVDEKMNYSHVFAQYYENLGRKLLFYEERLLCYKIHIGLGTLDFYAKSDQMESFVWAIDFIKPLIQD